MVFVCLATVLLAVNFWAQNALAGQDLSALNQNQLLQSLLSKKGLDKNVKKSYEKNGKSRIDDSIVDQKDVLLDLLELKLKEAKDKKRKKTERDEYFSSCTGNGSKCEPLKNIVAKLRANGISALGDLDLQLKFGSQGKGAVNIDAIGISNVGRASLDIDVADGNILIPGLGNLFSGKTLCSQIGSCKDNNSDIFRRNNNATDSVSNSPLGNGNEGAASVRAETATGAVSETTTVGTKTTIAPVRNDPKPNVQPPLVPPEPGLSQIAPIAPVPIAPLSAASVPIATVSNVPAPNAPVANAPVSHVPVPNAAFPVAPIAFPQPAVPPSGFPSPQPSLIQAVPGTQ